MNVQEERVTAVSYTHLDVYKRQIINSSGNVKALCFAQLLDNFFHPE